MRQSPKGIGRGKPVPFVQDSTEPREVRNALQGIVANNAREALQKRLHEGDELMQQFNWIPRPK